MTPTPIERTARERAKRIGKLCADAVTDIKHARAEVLADLLLPLFENHDAEVASLKAQLVELRGALPVRPQVVAFAQFMEAKLRENDHKGGWQHEPLSYLIKRLHEEYVELQGLCFKDVSQLDAVPPVMSRERREAFGREAADVANFAMMIADVCGALVSPTPDRPEAGKQP